VTIDFSGENVNMNRRNWLLTISGGTVVCACARGRAGEQDAYAKSKPEAVFGYCLNTSTLQGFKMSIDEELRLAGAVGYGAVEPWVRELEAYQAGGKSLDDLGKLARDLNLTIPSAIGFFEWVIDDDERRRAGFENARRSMERVRRIGGTRLAAPPVGATDRDDIDPSRMAERYGELLRIGSDIGVTPEVEVWGFSKTLGTLAEAAAVAIGCGRPDACILPDVYHLHKGGSPHRGLRMLNGSVIPAIHLNDYPATPGRDALTDAHRVYPGDGVAPLGEIVRDLRDIGFRGYLSLELFNREYWKQDPTTVARTGLDKMRAAVRSALG
jgi:sugar phosphate isomerase/epimerase